MDRCHQGRVRNALEPEWEARFEPRSYGFRPGRSCQDAIEAIYTTCKGPRAKRVWALDADLAAAFDRIDHDRLLEALGSFPARDMIRDWLKAGVFETGKGFAPTEEGTPQGGVISPLLLNVALHGLEEAAGVRYVDLRHQAGETKAGLTGGDQIRRRPGRALPHPASRPNRSRRGWPSGWRPGVWSSTRTRRRSCTSTRGSTSWGSTSAATAPSC